MSLAIGKKILQSVLKSTPYNLNGVQKVENVNFSLSNPHILDGCDEIVLKNKGKVKKYLGNKPVVDAANVLDEISNKTNTMTEVFNVLKTNMPPGELKIYLEKNNLKDLYNVFSKTGENGLFSVFLTKTLKNITGTAGSAIAGLKKENTALNGWKNSICQKFVQPEQKAAAFSKEELKNLYQKAFGSSKVPSGVNYDAFVYLNDLNPEIASKFDAHGLAKIGVADQLAQLNTLLSKGIDKNRAFFTAPLAVTESAGAGAGLGTAGGHAYRDGSFIVVGAKNKLIQNDGIKYVIVNDAYYNIIDDLAKRFPNQEFIRADKAAAFFNAM